MDDPEASTLAHAQGSAPPPVALEEPQAVGCGDNPPPPLVALAWSLPSDGAPQLLLSLREDAEVPANVELTYTFIAGGRFHRGALGDFLLSPEHPSRQVELDVGSLGPPDLNLQELTLAGHLNVSASTTDDQSSSIARRSAPPLYFHPDGGGLRIYGQEDYDLVYGRGDFAALRPSFAQEGEHQAGWLAGGFGLPPEVVAQIEVEDPHE